MTHDSTKSNSPPNDRLINDGSIVIAPNPVHSMVSIRYPCTLTGSLEITITDVVGRVVYTATVNCTDGNTVQHTIDMSGYMQGVYFVALMLSSEHVVKKIVKL